MKKEKEKQVIQLYKNGVAIKDIAIQTELTLNTVYVVLRRNNICVNSERLQTDAKVCELSGKMKASDIAKTIGISQSAVYATFRRYSIPLDLFAKNVILYVDGFLEEMADELKMPYNRDMRIEKLKEYFEKVDSST